MHNAPLAHRKKTKPAEARTVHLHHVTLPARHRLRFLNGIFEIGNEGINKWDRQPLKIPIAIISHMESRHQTTGNVLYKRCGQPEDH